ncbi:2-keto-4-pentenoate hydratase [Rhizobiales bacterium]|uniref:fumarylacetoacetate hydrolase family protein n=1 Tax=Hongsoonwoonella zoysiae TaxID=2821844 RepID=UPI00155FD72F|nr:fumarylacetoacetate hydrolase family protein [Hongsoonwoonella zoysiae]NRG17932.1 2-keto-4-pentenoate hydratase [Hongsoonwoonella zoysiae]
MDDQTANHPSDLARALASHLIAARERGRPLAAWRGYETLTADDAYCVQSIVTESYGPAGGFKVACKPDQPNIMAPILTSDILFSPAVLTAPGEENIGMELEIGFRLLAPPPPVDIPDFTDRLRECVEVVPVIEIVRSRLSGHESAPALLKLADNQINGGLVAGAPLADWSPEDLSAVSARLSLGGETVLDGMAHVPGGNAFANLCELVRMIGDHCGGLKPGHIVITGSLNGLPYVKPGMRIEGKIRGIGDVSLDLEAAP